MKRVAKLRHGLEITGPYGIETGSIGCPNARRILFVVLSRSQPGDRTLDWAASPSARVAFAVTNPAGLGE